MHEAKSGDKASFDKNNNRIEFNLKKPDFDGKTLGITWLMVIILKIYHRPDWAKMIILWVIGDLRRQYRKEVDGKLVPADNVCSNSISFCYLGVLMAMHPQESTRDVLTEYSEVNPPAVDGVVMLMII